MADPKLLILDLDGTTLNAHSEIAAGDLAAAEALRQHGIEITVATGRLFTGTQQFARQLGVRGSVAVMNGSELIDVQTSTLRHGTYLESGSRRTIREALEDHALTTFVFTSRRIHFNRRDDDHAPYLKIWTEDLVSHDNIFAATEWNDADLVALCAIGSPASIDAARDAILDAHGDTVHPVQFDTHHGHRFLKLRRKGEDKGTAVHRLAAERGFAADECVVVGDWINDIPMLRSPARSFAMGHAPEHVRREADEVLEATRATGGGVAEVARRVWGIEAGDYRRIRR